MPTGTEVLDRTLGDLVVEVSARSRVLERHHVDYCCRGRRTLAAAAAEAGLDPATLAAEIAAVVPDRGVDVASFGPVGLIEHLLVTHHAYLHEELPALVWLAAQVRDTHRERHPELDDVARLVTAIRDDLEPHLTEEERVLFPAIRQLVEAPDVPMPISQPISVTAQEHDRAGQLLAELRRVAAGYRPPEDACTSYRALYGRLAVLEADTFRHIHLENNVLFPAVLDLGR